MMKNRNRKILVQKGAVTILLTVMVLNVLLVIGLGVSVLIFQQIKSPDSTRQEFSYFAH